MHFVHFIKKKTIAAAAGIFFISIAMAQDTTPATSAAKEGSNLLAILLITTALVLAFVIWGMGQALIAISRQVMEKNKTAGSRLSILLLIGFSLLSQISNAQNTAAAAAIEQSPNYGGLSSNNFYAFVGVIIIEIAAIFFLAFSINRIYQELLPEKVAAVTPSSSKMLVWWSAFDKKFLTKAVAVEREADILLDHNYDGIRELDNSLPPWWKYGFIFTIVTAFAYLFIFHVSGTGKNPTEEYATEMESARIEKEIFDANNKDKVDENNIAMADINGIKAGHEMFEANCAACHLNDGGGSVGPNLTDDYWLHKGSLNDIFKTIKTGYPDKGMQGWSTKFSPKEMSQIASYIKTLRGSKPATPKAPQGDVYIESNPGSLPANKADSTATAIKTN